MIVEDMDHRVWAALRPVDAVTGQTVEATVQGNGQRWLCNRLGLWVLNGLAAPTPRADEWLAYEDLFESARALAPLAVQAVLHASSGRHLPRRVTLTLPLADTGAEPPLFKPADVPLYPAPQGALATGWALLRVSLRRGTRPAAGAVLSLHEGDTTTPLLGRGQSDERGEAVVAVPGLARFRRNPAAPPPFLREHPLQLHIVWDPLAGQSDGPPDPDQLAAQTGGGLATTSLAVDLASGESRTLAVDL